MPQKTKDKPKRKLQALSRRTVLKCGLYSGLMSTLAPALWINGCSRKQQGKRPNIIMIVIDTLRADHLSCYGYFRNTTPNIDRLANQAIMFKKAISAAPWTLPSIASLLTSQYPSVLGIHDQPVIFSDKFPLLSEVLKHNNYITYGIVSHDLLSPEIGFGRGFDKYANENSPQGRQGVTSPAVTDKAVSFLKRGHRQPFFLFLHYFDPHYNFILHEEFNYYPTYGGYLKSNHPIIDLWHRRDSLNSEDLRFLLSLYDSEISFTDKYVGQVLDELKNQKIYDDSIIIITSDHGEEFMERGWIGHCTSLYQELIHVPLIIKLPGCQVKEIKESVGLIDIMPAVLDYLKLEKNAELEGKALNFNRDNFVEASPVFSETFNHVLEKYQVPNVENPKRTEHIALKSVIMGDMKLIYDEIRDTKQLYDLLVDEKELNSVSDLSSDKNKSLQKLLADWISHVGQKQQPNAGQPESLFTPAEKQRLKSLGYLQ